MPLRAVMTNGVNKQCSTSSIRSLYCLSFSRSFMLYALVSSWLPCRWAIGLSTLISKNARCPEIQNPLAAISTRASSVTLAVFSCSDSPISCWSVGSINTSWHMTFRRLAVRSGIWLWRRLYTLLRENNGGICLSLENQLASFKISVLRNTSSIFWRNINKYYISSFVLSILLASPHPGYK